MEKVFQGEIDINKGATIVATTTSIIINLIVINNLTDDYIFTLNRSSNSSTVPIYSFDLKLGDTIRDSQSYTLAVGDSLVLSTDKVGTTYYISYIEI